MATPADVMARVLAEEASQASFDSDFAPNPYSPYDAAKALATADAVPFLIDVVQSDGPGRKWAIYALGLLGPLARDAAPVLEAAAEWVALFRVDDARARAAKVHLRRDPAAPSSSVRAAVTEIVSKRGAWEARAHFAELLADEDTDQLLFALDANARDSSRLRKLAEVEPAAVPVSEVRTLLSHGSDEVVTAAARVLADLHLPVDAQRVLDVVGGRGIQLVCAEWTAPLRDSEVLIDGAGLLELNELVRRRRCAGLSIDVERIRPKVLAALAPAALTKAWNARAAREMDLSNASQIVCELRDAVCADALVDVIGPDDDGVEARFEDLTMAFASLGAAGDAALERGRLRVSGERAERIGWLLDTIAKIRRGVPGHTLALADKYFADGLLEDWLLKKSAHATYAEVLAREPRNAHAAYQLAWIDRGFGTPITVERVAWLRELGLKEGLLDELARRPLGILHGTRSSHRSIREPNPVRALQAEQAGLYPVAALYHDVKSREGARCLEQTRTHLAKVRSGMR